MKIFATVILIVLSAYIGWHMSLPNHVEVFIVQGTDPSFEKEASKIADFTKDTLEKKQNLKIVYPLRIIVASNNEEYSRVYKTWMGGSSYEDGNLLGFLQNHFPKLHYRHDIVIVGNENTKGLQFTHSVVHEMIHSFQFSLGHSLSEGPQTSWANQKLVKQLRWFTEGACDVIAAKIVADYGFPEDAEQRYYERTIAELKSKSNLPKLSQLNSDFWDKFSGDRSALYALGRLAVMKLEKNYGEDKIFQYYVELNESKDVPKSFEKAFRISLTQFESSFEAELPQLLK